MTTIGFVGLGAMGSRIAGRLLEGNTLYGTNRTASRASELTRRGMITRDIAAFFEVLARMAAAPGATARPARSGMLTVGTAGSTP
jgi:pyrroline-5-carboxylate reductase